VILDFEKTPGPVDIHHDVCIVGAGAAGISLALELTRRGARVLLLEAGGRGFEARSHALYEGEATGLPYRGLVEGRFRGLGGTTTQWGGQILEIDPLPFRERAWAPDGGWPFEKSALAPYYELALRLEGLDGALADPQEIWRGLGLSAPDFGGELISAFSRWCPETNFATLHGATLRGAPGLTVLLHANVRELVLTPDGDAILSVSCVSLGGRQASFTADAYVLAMGGIETSRLLLQPLSCGRAHPWNQFGQVGLHFQDHLVCDAGVVEAPGLDPARAYFDYASLGGRRYHPKMKLSPDLQERLEVLDVCGTVSLTVDGQDDVARAYETFRNIKTRRFDRCTPSDLTHFALNLHKLVWHKIPYSRSASSGAGRRTELSLSVHCEQSPTTSGRISLVSRTDALGLKQAQVDWRLSELEIRSIRAYVEVAARVFAERGIGAVHPHPEIMVDDDALAARVRESSHHIGGTRMARRAEAGVVDPDLKLFGVGNGYVCSSSVFPSAGFVNPTHTIVALAVRLAEHLASRIPS
jgi:choline dehydrogenase-like flavoprotein